MNTTTRQGPRRWIFAGLVGMSLGIGLSDALARLSVEAKAAPVALALARFGRLPRSTPADDPDAAKKDEQARRAANSVVDGLVKKDVAALAALCGSPFLGGRMHELRAMKDPAAIRLSLSPGATGRTRPVLRSIVRPVAPGARRSPGSTST